MQEKAAPPDTPARAGRVREAQRLRGYEHAPISYTSRRYSDPAMQAYAERRKEAILRVLRERKLLNARSARILDVGCGTGIVLSELVAATTQPLFFGIDISSRMLREASGRVASKRAFLVRGSAFQLPFPDSSFDAIVSTRFIHQYPHDQKRRILGEMRRCLNPGGVAIVEFYSFPAWLIRYPFSRRVRRREYFMHAPTRRRVRELVGGRFQTTRLRLTGACGISRVIGQKAAMKVHGVLDACHFSWAFDEYLVLFTKKDCDAGD